MITLLRQLRSAPRKPTMYSNSSCCPKWKSCSNETQNFYLPVFLYLCSLCYSTKNNYYKRQNGNVSTKTKRFISASEYQYFSNVLFLSLYVRLKSPTTLLKTQPLSPSYTTSYITLQSHHLHCNSSHKPALTTTQKKCIPIPLKQTNLLTIFQLPSRTIPPSESAP